MESVTRDTRRKEVIERRKLFLRAMVGVEAIFDLAVEGEVEGPADGIADDVGREATVKCPYVAFIPGNVADYAE